MNENIMHIIPTSPQFFNTFIIRFEFQHRYQVFVIFDLL